MQNEIPGFWQQYQSCVHFIKENYQQYPPYKLVNIWRSFVEDIIEERLTGFNEVFVFEQRNGILFRSYAEEILNQEELHGNIEAVTVLNEIRNWDEKLKQKLSITSLHPYWWDTNAWKN